MEQRQHGAPSSQTVSSAHDDNQGSGRNSASTAVAPANGLDLGGLRSALATLNTRTRYRFTGVYRFDPPLLRNVGLYDRENPSLNLSGDIHLLVDTYCSIVKVAGRPFTTDDAPADPRLVAHSARNRIISYFGIPLRIAGEVRGVLCHFDGRPRFAPPGEVEFLTGIEPLLVNYLEH